MRYERDGAGQRIRPAASAEGSPLTPASPPVAMASAATGEGALGLYPAHDFVLTGDGTCDGCATPRAALWYFRRETIAVPRPGGTVAGYATATPPFDDVRAWAASRSDDAPIDYPPLVWVAAPEIVRDARLASDGASLATGGGKLPIELVPKIALNRAYYDASSTRFFAGRALSVRGSMRADGRYVVRTIWPQDWRLREAPQARAALDEQPREALRRWMRAEPNGGASSPFAAATIWQRPGTAADLRGRPVLAFIVNGAQGDDDEAHAGHFAIVTGRVQDDGAIGQWLVNNFYTLDAESEKGIIAAPVPLDNYLADLNSGQAYYRPSCLLVAVLRSEHAAALVQSALGRVYNQFYRHQLTYYHPIHNCTGISIDTLRALGWSIPGRGAASRALAWIGFPFVALRERSIEKAKQAFDYLTTDQTRLLPAAAFEEVLASLLALRAGPPADGTLARMLAEDVEAIALLRFPQIPSSRVSGDAPVVTMREYRARIPRDPAKRQIVPVPERPFPESLRDPDLLPRPRRPSDFAAVAWGVALLLGAAFCAWLLLARLASAATGA